MTRSRGLLTIVRSNVSFLAFSAIVGYRCTHGQSHGAYQMLLSTGAHPYMANAIIEEWPTQEEAVRAGKLAGVKPGEWAAYMFARHIDGIGKYDWTLKLQKAIKASTATTAAI